MKQWNFKVKSSPEEIIEKLEKAISSVDGFVFNQNGNSDALNFSMRKRIIYPNQIMHRNRVVVKGKVLKSGNDQKSDVQISFSQHFVMTLTVITALVSFLYIALSGMVSNKTVIIIAGLLLAIGFVLWFALRKKIDDDIQKHKSLISEILEL